MQIIRRIVAAAGLAAACAASAQVQPVLTVAYDQGFDGQGRGGPVAGTLVGKPELAPGRSGQALRSGPGTGYVEYPTAGLLNLAGGTVEMWVCPLDWKPADEEFHVFFEVRGDGALYLYKYYQGVNLLMLTCQNTNGPYTSSAFAVAEWQPGQWHHIAGTWSADGVLAYVDGKPAGKQPTEGPLPARLGESVRIGDHPWHLPRTSASLVDDVRIYDRPLGPAHIAAHAAGTYDFQAPLTADSCRLFADPDPEHRETRVRFTTGGADVEDARLRVRLALVAKGAPLPAEAVTATVTGGQAVQALPLPEAPGQYEVAAEVQMNGQPAFSLSRALVVPSLEWQGNRLGTEDRVLPPWTPLRVQGTTVACWGREYAFADSALPSQVTAAGQPLLARPVALTATRAGQPVAWQPGGVRVAKASGTRVELAGDLAAGDVRLQVRATLEYDGLLLLELAAAESAPPTVDTLTLEIALPSERALYRHRWASDWAGPAGAVPPGTGVVEHEPFIPYVWLGDNDRGLFWFCESDEQWPNAAAADAVAVVRDPAGGVSLRLSLLTVGQKLPDKWRFTCGLQATPVKPLPKDWRHWRMTPGRNANVQILWPTPQPDSVRYFGYPEATDSARYRQAVEGFQGKGVKAVPYLCLSFLSAACPEWPFFRTAWAMGGADTGSSDVAAYGAPFAIVSPVGKEYPDFIVWKTARFIDQYGIDGLYHDNTHPYSSANLEAGCGYLRDGTRHQTFPILGYRALYRRMYAVTKALPRPTFSMAHMSGKVTIPILAYEDAYLDGEHFRGRVKDSYLDLLPLDTFRTEYTGRQWGLMPFFLPEFDAEHAAQVEPTRGLMGLLMIHDVSPWPIWCNAEEANRALSALDEFGYADAEFLPYFGDAPPAATDIPDVYASGYRRSDRSVLLVVANLGRVDRAGEVRLAQAGLGIAPGSVSLWPEGGPLPLTGSAVRLDVPRLGYRLLLVKPAGG